MTPAAPGEITTLFWDIGGVILSNGWDREMRQQAGTRFGLDMKEIETRHAAAFPEFEIGEMTLTAYLDRVVFYRPQSFTREEFTVFLMEQSSENNGARAVLDEVTATHRYLLATINNEGLELNTHRITTYELTRNFIAFFSSCYMKVRKPDERIYRMALQITQRRPEECIFIDDRLENLRPARAIGMHAVHFDTAEKLRYDLASLGVSGASR